LVEPLRPPLETAVEHMEREGIVGPANGMKPPDILA